MTLILSDTQKGTFHVGEEKYSEISLKNFVIHIKRNKNSKKIFTLMIINFSFMFVELIYGILSNSLSLISDSAHMLFDSSALAIGLYAQFMSKLSPTLLFSYGYQRFSVLSGFVNGLFLLFVAFNIFIESIERILEPQIVLSEKMMVVSILGLIINLVGLCFFHEHSHVHDEDDEEDHCHEGHSHSHDHHSHDHHSHEEEHQQMIQINSPQKNSSIEQLRQDSQDISDISSSSLFEKHKDDHSHPDHHHEDYDHDHDHDHDHKDHKHHHDHKEHDHHKHDQKAHDHSGNHHHHHDENLTGVFLHILADTLGSVGALASSLLIQWKQWYISDPITSFIISILIFLSTFPLLQQSLRILLQSYPKRHKPILTKILDQISSLEEVQQYQRVKLWAYTGSNLVFSIEILLKDSYKNEHQKVTKKANNILREFKQIKYTTVDVLIEENKEQKELQ